MPPKQEQPGPAKDTNTRTSRSRSVTTDQRRPAGRRVQPLNSAREAAVFAESPTVAMGKRKNSATSSDSRPMGGGFTSVNQDKRKESAPSTDRPDSGGGFIAANQSKRKREEQGVDSNRGMCCSSDARPLTPIYMASSTRY